MRKVRLLGSRPAAGTTINWRSLLIEMLRKVKPVAFRLVFVPLYVGVRGHFSGGGYGNIMRKYGLLVDNIIDAQLAS